MNYSVVIAGETVNVTLEHTVHNNNHEIRAAIGDRSYALEASSVKPGVYVLNWNHQSIEVFVTPAGDAYSVSIGTQQIPVEILDARRKLKRTVRGSHTGAAEVRAPMPGKIVRVLVREGGDVEPGQGIVVVEAMKMQNEIKSPTRGKIQKLEVVEGAAVRAGDLIAVVEAQ